MKNSGSSTPRLINDVAPGRRPEWLKVRLASNRTYRDVAELISNNRLNTVCRSAHCPNIGECWGRGTATFMILGDICTRDCRFCAIAKGKPDPVDEGEPDRLARVAKKMGLRWIVLTSVDRDDLHDGGASYFAKTIAAIRNAVPDAGIEALVPDFRDKPGAVDIICSEPPDILNHNVETVPRLYRSVRPGADYNLSLELLKTFAERGLVTKAGLFVGVGETDGEVRAVIRDLRNAGVRSLTIGQYLAPSNAHLRVAKYVHPDEFAELAEFAYSIGFEHVASGPLVRSSYRAEEALKVYPATRAHKNAGT